MARSRMTWAHTIVKSDAHTVAVLSPDEMHPDFDVEVTFCVPARTEDEAAEMTYSTLDLEDYIIKTTEIEDGLKVSCSFRVRANSPEEINEMVKQAWKGTPAWRAVLREVEMFANYSVLS